MNRDLPDSCAPLPFLILSENNNVIQLELRDPVTLIGRGKTNQIQIQRKQISHFHLEIARLAGGRYRVRDLSSKNGSMINGITLGVSELHDGDRLTLGGEVTIHFLQLTRSSDPSLDRVKLQEYCDLDSRVADIRENEAALQSRLQKKIHEYQDLLDSIVRIKTEPTVAFEEIYGDGEIHFPVSIPLASPRTGTVPVDRREGAPTDTSEVELPA